MRPITVTNQGTASEGPGQELLGTNSEAPYSSSFCLFLPSHIFLSREQERWELGETFASMLCFNGANMVTKQIWTGDNMEASPTPPPHSDLDINRGYKKIGAAV